MPTRTAFADSTLRGAGLTFRPATLDDVPWVAALQTARDPGEPGNEAQLRHWWRLMNPDRFDERWIVEEAGAPVGFASFSHPAWESAPMRASRLMIWLPRGDGRPAHLRRGLEVLEPYAAAAGTRLYTSNLREDFEDEHGAFVALGYREGRRSQGWELDLAANRAALEAMADGSRGRMRDEGIEITTIDHVADAEKWHKLHEMCEESLQDVPTTVPHAPESFASFTQWMSSPGVHHDRLWVARAGDSIVGMSLLEYPPGGVGNVWTDYTGTSRSVRGHGVGRALKCETVLQAIAVGVTHVRTNNDGENKPILHLNREMGYQRIPGWVQFLKDAPKG